MIRTSWLDDLIERFQHRWETNPQYRAAMSGVLGLVFLITMCTCVGLVTAGANVALASLGFGSSSGDQGGSNTGTKEVKGFATFPVTTYVPQTPNAIPQGTVPSSGTPLPTPTAQPTATDAPTATPCQSNCGGGGGGGGGGCQSCTVTASGSPTPWVHGQQGFVNVQTSRPNVPINIIVSFSGGCPSQLNNGAGMTDASGYYSWQVGGAPNGKVNPCTGTAQVLVEAGFNNGADLKSFSFNQPVA
jgi:hypothetical protein